MVKPRIIGRYAVFDEIAAGGMAAVHLGRLLAEAGFSRTVAIKRLHPQFGRDPDFVTMFLDEARLASRIRHPNVVSTLDIVTEGDDVLLVMEYVVGESLSRLIREARPSAVPMPIAIAVMTSVLHGLHAAHEAKTEQGEPLAIVHRDVSPQNILVGVDGVARVLDFGVAKASLRAQTTKEGQLKGKLSYMAPEQLRRDVLDRRSDVYAAAVVLWECITGQRLFQADSEARVVMKMLSEEVPPPSLHTPGIPSALDDVVLKGLAREPTERFATAREMAIALERCGVAAASSSAIGEWVEGLAATSLASRAARVGEIERASDQGIPAAGSSRRLEVPTAVGAAFRTSLESLATIPEPVDPEQVPSSVRYTTSATLPGQDAARPRRGVRAALAIGTVAVVMGLGVAAFGLLSKKSATAHAGANAPPVAAESTLPASTEVAASPPQTGAPPTETPPPSAEASPSTPVITPVVAPQAKPRATAAPTAAEAKVTPARVPAAAAAPPKSDACKPPYTVDSAGIRHLKPQCF